MSVRIPLDSKPEKLDDAENDGPWVIVMRAITGKKKREKRPTGSK